MQALFGFLAGIGACALIWIDGERAERRYRIQRAAEGSLCENCDELLARTAA